MNNDDWLQPGNFLLNCASLAKHYIIMNYEL